MKDKAAFIRIARITKTQGLNGLVRIHMMLEDPGIFEPGRRVTVVHGSATQVSEIELFRKQHGRNVLKLRGIDSIDQAQALVGAELEIPEADLPDPDEGSFYTFDLKGCRVSGVDGETLGTVTDVMDWGGTPLLKVDGEDGEILIPFAKEFLKTVDPEQRHIVVDLPEGLRDLNK